MTKGNVFCIIFYSAVINIILTPLNGNIARFFGYITILLLFSLAFFTKRNVVIHKNILVILIIVMISCCLSFEYFDLSNFTNYIVATFSFISFYNLLQDNHTIELSFEKIYYPSLILSIVFMIYSFCNLPFTYTTINEYGGKLFTMGLGNPNAVSFYILFLIMLFSIRFSYRKNIIEKVILIGLFCAMFVILLRLESRNVIICSGCTILLFCFNLLRKSKIIKWCFCSIPFLMVPALMLYYNQIDGYMLMGKALNTGRDIIYNSYLQELSQNPLIIFLGSYFHYPFSNLHNGPLSILASTGIVGLIMIICIWYKVLKSIGSCLENKCEDLAYSYIFILILQSSMETLSIIGTIPYSIFMLAIVFIAKGNVKLGKDTVV